MSSMLPERLTVPKGSRLILFLCGLIILAIGVVAFFSRYFLEDAFLYVVGGTMIVLGFLKFTQWLWGKLRRSNKPTRGFRNIALQSITDIVIGYLLFSYRSLTVPLLSIVVGVLLMVDAALQLIVVKRMPTGRSKTMLAFSGLLSGVVGLVAIFLCMHPLASTWLSYLLGFKLALFGGTLMAVAWFSKNDEEETLVYGTYSTSPGDKIPGELYAVTFGPAFHLGVYIGNDEVVDFHFDNKVAHVSWEDFALGRQPQRWEYPDLPPTPPDAVIATAIAQIGKQYKYEAVTFNCENFAIYCKSGGKTVISKYAQAPMGLELLTKHPILGSLLESFSRICNWIAYLVGGNAGQKFGLAVRSLSSRVSGWLATSPSEELLKRFENAPKPYVPVEKTPSPQP